MQEALYSNASYLKKEAIETHLIHHPLHRRRFRVYLETRLFDNSASKYSFAQPTDFESFAYSKIVVISNDFSTFSQWQQIHNSTADENFCINFGLESFALRTAIKSKTRSLVWSPLQHCFQVFLQSLIFPCFCYFVALNELSPNSTRFVSNSTSIHKQWRQRNQQTPCPWLYPIHP